MNLLFIAGVLDVIGVVLIATVVFRVHGHVLKERKIDDDVLTSMKRERGYVLVGVALIILGYLLELWNALM